MMKPFDRRRFLVSGTGALAAAALCPRQRAAAAPDPRDDAAPPARPASAAAQVPAGTHVPPAPVARVEIVRDTYFGETLADPYRWMENDKDRDWLPFLEGQNRHARAILDDLPGRSALLARIQKVSGDTVLTNKVQRAGGVTFIQQRPAGADNFKLYARGGGHDRVLIDPTALAAGDGHWSMDWWKASPDGRHIVYGLSRDGSEDSTLHVLSVADGRVLPDSIPGTQEAVPQWLDDGSGFFYNQLTGAVDTPERFLDSRARFHRLGSNPSDDPILMRRGLVHGIEFEPIQMPYIVTNPGSRYVLLALTDVRPEFRLYLAPLAEVLAGRARWTKVADFEDEVTSAELDGEDLYLIANRGAPRGRIVKTPGAAPNLATAVEVVPQGATVIEDLSRALDGFYLRIMDGGIHRLRRLDRGGRVTDIELPFDGTLSAVFANPAESGALIALTGWLSPSGIWEVRADGRVTDTGITPKPRIDVSPYQSSRMFAAAHDGTKIPYTLIHRKGLELDGGNPLWISAYGSYGITAYSPAFNPRILALIDAGAVVGYANVRGGGEYGREWHKAGQLANKPNTWRDLIAVCEELCAKRYTSREHLAIGGRSAGGITVGRALTERPDLFAAVIDGVGWSNPLRYVAEQNGYGEEPEWGAISSESGYHALKAIDSYQSVKDGTRYPAVLLTTGVTDPRVAPFHAAKMAARLQAASTSGKPILLRVDFDAGHGIGSTRAQQDREAADTYAFLLRWTA
jgi:prolyl oligopeptidase